MVLEASGSFSETMIDGLESWGGCSDAICTLLHKNMYAFGSFRRLLRSHDWWVGISKRLQWSHLRTFANYKIWFWKLQEATVHPVLMVWNLEEGAVKPFTHFDNEILMVVNCKEATVKPFTKFSNDILTFWLQFDETSQLAGSDVCRHLGVRWRPAAAPLGAA